MMFETVDSRYLIEGSSFFYFRRGSQIFLGSCYAIPPVIVHDPAGSPWVMMTPGVKSYIYGRLKNALDDYLGRSA